MTRKHTTQADTNPWIEFKASVSLPELMSLIAPVWPLSGAVACNPLQGLEDYSFAEATQMGQRLLGARTLPAMWHLRSSGDLSDNQVREIIQEMADDLPQAGIAIDWEDLLHSMYQTFDERNDLPAQSSALLAEAVASWGQESSWTHRLDAVNGQVIQWLGAFLDEGQAAWGMPLRREGFYAALRALLRHDKLGRKHKSWLAGLSDDPEQALYQILKDIPIDQDQYGRYLRDQLLALPGWAGFIKWRSEQTDYEPQQKYPIDLTEYLTVRVLIDHLLPKGTTKKAGPNRSVQQLHQWLTEYLQPTADVAAGEWGTLLWNVQFAQSALSLQLLQAWEAGFRQKLTLDLEASAKKETGISRPDAQMAFCIDVRSEPFRQQVEGSGNYETLGFAGFFGLPVAYKTALGERIKSLPVLLQPAHELETTTTAACSHQLESYKRGRTLLNELKAAYKSLKYNLATPFAAVEALGLPAALITIGRSLIPRQLTKWRTGGRKWFYPGIDLVPDINPHKDLGIPLENQIAYAGNALRMMGLTTNFAPLVVFCGHGSQTENNPYAAALDCGACGGRHGGPNAAALSRILNQDVVRHELREAGIDIPEDTLFVGAQHNTTTDAVTLLDLPKLDKEKAEQIAELRRDLQRAQGGNLDYRAPHFGESNGKDLLRRSADWSEVRPEWGLAGNAGFIAAPRHLTSNLDLKGRCFLHSYDWEQDTENTSLETILTAPLVVAQWINNQYYFSTVDPVAFGSGNKITHNVVGKVGVMQGNGSDLMHGLPMQSVQRSDKELYHQPLRLTAFVYTPRERVEALVEKHDILQKLLYNEWIFLQVLDPLRKESYLLRADGTWETVTNKSEEAVLS